MPLRISSVLHQSRFFDVSAFNGRFFSGGITGISLTPGALEILAEIVILIQVAIVSTVLCHQSRSSSLV